MLYGTPPHERYKRPSLTGRGTIYQQESGSRSLRYSPAGQLNHHTLPDELEEVVDPH